MNHFLNPNPFKASYFKSVFCLSLIAFMNPSAAQDASVYVSPFDMGRTLSNIYFSIDKNGFSYVNTLKEKSDNFDKDQFKGNVQIVTFETSEVSRLIACEPTAALEFPLRIIVWEEENDIYLAYINPIFYKRRHFISGCDEVIKDLNKSLIRVINDAIRTQ